MKIFSKENPTLFGTIIGKDCTVLFNLVRIAQVLVAIGLAYWVISDYPSLRLDWFTFLMWTLFVPYAFVGTLWTAKPFIIKELNTINKNTITQ